MGFQTPNDEQTRVSARACLCSRHTCPFRAAAHVPGDGPDPLTCTHVECPERGFLVESGPLGASLYSAALLGHRLASAAAALSGSTSTDHDQAETDDHNGTEGSDEPAAEQGSLNSTVRAVVEHSGLGGALVRGFSASEIGRAIGLSCAAVLHRVSRDLGVPRSTGVSRLRELLRQSSA